MNKLKFSIVLIAKDEEKTLPRLLGSLAEFQVSGGEVVVLDTGSTDGTVNEAYVRGCVIHEVGDKFLRTVDEVYAVSINEKFCIGGESSVVHGGDRYFDYSAARNHAASLASNDFVWMPDCDEVFTAFDLEAIDRLLVTRTGDRTLVARLEYNFVYCHDQFGTAAIKFLHSKAYDRRAFEWVGVIHEVLRPIGDGPHSTALISEGWVKLEHYQDVTRDRSGYLRGLALDCYEHPYNDRNAHYLGRELLWSGRPKSAINVLVKHIGMRKWPAEAAQSMVFIGDAGLALGRVEDAKVAWHRAFVMDGSRREALMRLATQSWKDGDAQRTAAYCAAALTIPWSAYYANDVADYTQRPHEMLYWALHNLGDSEGAASHWRAAAEYQPLNPKYIHDGKFYLKDPGLDIGEFTTAIRDGVSFSFVRMGEAELACMRGGRDHDQWLTTALRDAYQRLVGHVHVVHSDHQDDYDMLLHRDNQPTAPVVAFWSAIRDAGRPKAIISSGRMDDLVNFFDAGEARYNIEVSETSDFDHYDVVRRRLLEWASASEDPILVFCCGPLGKVLIADVLSARGSDDVTCIDAGHFFGLTLPVQTGSPGLEWTGERYIPGVTPLSIEVEHLTRYQWAANYTRGLSVLDAACGEGYGKTILGASEYLGVDISEECVQHAVEKYGNSYEVTDLEEPQLSTDYRRDVVVSFETIEHLSDPHPFLRWSKNNARVFICSVPVNQSSEFHKVVYSVNQIESLITKYWPGAVFYHQVGSVIRPLRAVGVVTDGYVLALCGLPPVSIVIPTLGRTQSLYKCLELIKENADYPYYEVIVESDSFLNRVGCPRTLARGVAKAKHNLIMYLGNDTEPQPGFLREVVKCMLHNFPDLDGLVGLNDGGDPRVARHWLAGHKLLGLIGDTEFFHTGYNHVGCDNELTARARKINKYAHAERSVILHSHGPSQGFTDPIYDLGWDADKVRADHELLEVRADQLGFRDWLVK